MHRFGSGWCRRPGSGGADGRKIKMPAFDRGDEAALAPQSEQVWVENLSLKTETTAVERALNFPRLCPPRNSPLCSIRATLSALSMRAKCSAKIRSVHDRRNDLACRRGERLRFNRRRHAQRWATPILGAPTSRSSPASRRSPAARCSHAVRLIPSRFAAASIRARTCVSKRRLIVAKWPARELLARYSRLVSAQRHPLSHSVPQPGAL